MENFLKYLSGGIAAAVSLFAPIRPLILCAVIFITIDFVTGVAADYKRARRDGRNWAFESQRAWTTILKLAFVLSGIVMAWMIDTQILAFMKLNLANLFTGFVCGVEFWSYLENAAEISNHPIFVRLKRYMKQKMNESLGNSNDQ